MNGEYTQQPPELPIRRPYVSQHSLDFGSLDKNLKESSVDPSSTDESDHDYETPIEILNKQAPSEPVHKCLAEDIIAQFDDLPEDSVDPVTDEISSASSTEDASLPEDLKERPSASSFDDENTSEERKTETEELPTEKAVTEKSFDSAENVSNETSTDEEENNNLFQFEVSRPPKQSGEPEKIESMLEKHIAIVRLKSHSLSDENTLDLIPRVKSPFYSDEELLEVEKSLDDLDKHLTDNELDVETDDEELFIVDSTKSYPKHIPTTAKTEDFRSDSSSEDESKEQNLNDVVDKVQPDSDSGKSEKVIEPVSVKDGRLRNDLILPQEENKALIESKETLRLEKEGNLSDMMESKACLSQEMPENKEEERNMVTTSVSDHTVDVNTGENLDEKMEASQLKELKPEILHDGSIDVTEHDEKEHQLLSDEEIESVNGVVVDTNVKTYKKDATEQQKEEHNMVATDEVVVVATETKTETSPEGNIRSSVSDHTVDVNTEENLDEKMEASQLKELKPEILHDDSVDDTEHDEREHQLLSDEEIESVNGVVGGTNVKTYKKDAKEEHSMVATDEVVVVATETKIETSSEGNIGSSVSDHTVHVNTEENLDKKIDASQLKELKPETLQDDGIDDTEHDRRERQFLSDEEIESVTGALGVTNVTYEKDATTMESLSEDSDNVDKQRYSRSDVSKAYLETVPEQLFEVKARNLPKEDSVPDTKEEEVVLKEQEHKEDSSFSIERSEPEKSLIVVDRKREADDGLPALGTTITALTNTQPEEDNKPNISSEVDDLFASEAVRRELKKQESIGKDFTSSDEDELENPLRDKSLSGKDSSSESEGIISAEFSVKDQETRKINIGVKEVEIQTESDSEKLEEVVEEYQQSFTVAVQEFSINLEDLPDDSGKILDDQEKQPDEDSKPETLFNRIPSEELETIKLKKGSFIEDYCLKETLSEVDSEEKENQVYSQRMKGKMLSKISDDITEIESWIIGPNISATEALVNVSLGTQEQLFVPPDKIDEIDKKDVDKRPYDEGYSSPRDARTFDLTETKIEFETPEEIKPVLRDYPEPISPNRKLTLLKIHRVFTISGSHNVSAVRKLGPYFSYTSATF